MVSFIGTNGMEDFKLLPDLNFKAAMKPVFFHFHLKHFHNYDEILVITDRKHYKHN